MCPEPCSMPDGRLADGEGQRGTDRSAPRWTHSLALAASVGIVFFLLAKLGLGLRAASEFVAVFWPAMGFGVAVLIGLGPSARWPVLSQQRGPAPDRRSDVPIGSNGMFGPGLIGSALVRSGVQPCSVAPRAWPARRCSLRKRGWFSLLDSCVEIILRPNWTDPNDFSILVFERHDRFYYAWAVCARAFCCLAATAASAG